MSDGSDEGENVGDGGGKGLEKKEKKEEEERLEIGMEWEKSREKRGLTKPPATNQGRCRRHGARSKGDKRAKGRRPIGSPVRQKRGRGARVWPAQRPGTYRSGGNGGSGRGM